MTNEERETKIRAAIDAALAAGRRVGPLESGNECGLSCLVPKNEHGITAWAAIVLETTRAWAWSFVDGFDGHPLGYYEWAAETDADAYTMGQKFRAEALQRNEGSAP